MNQESPTNVRWIVLVLVAFASASAYLTRYCISAANSTIRQDLGFTDTQMGLVLGAFALGYLFGQVPGGWLGNRFGTRFAFAAVSILWSLCNVWSALAGGDVTAWGSRVASSFTWLRSFRLLHFLPVVSAEIVPLATTRASLGFLQGGLSPISARILKDWIPLPHRGKSSACIAASMSVGGAFTLWLTGWLLDAGVGWRSIFHGYSLVGIVWGIAFYWYFRTRPQEHRGLNAEEVELIQRHEKAQASSTAPGRQSEEPPDPESTDSSRKSARQDALAMATSLGMWAFCIQSFFRAAGYAFFVTWFFNFLESRFNINKAEAGFLTSLPLIAVVIGSLSGGAVVDRLLTSTGSKWISRTGTATAALAICGVLTIVSAWTGSATQLATVMAAGALFSGMANPAAWACTIDIGGRNTAQVMAVMNMAGCLAGVVLPIFLGSWFEDIKQTGGEADWAQVIYLHAGFYFTAAVSWLCVNPNRAVIGD